jgi:hypothetical protein
MTGNLTLPPAERGPRPLADIFDKALAEIARRSGINARQVTETEASVPQHLPCPGGRFGHLALTAGEKGRFVLQHGRALDHGTRSFLHQMLRRTRPLSVKQAAWLERLFRAAAARQADGRR